MSASTKPQRAPMGGPVIHDWWLWSGSFWNGLGQWGSAAPFAPGNVPKKLSKVRFSFKMTTTCWIGYVTGVGVGVLVGTAVFVGALVGPGVLVADAATSAALRASRPQPAVASAPALAVASRAVMNRRR